MDIRRERVRYSREVVSMMKDYYDNKNSILIIIIIIILIIIVMNIVHQYVLT